MKESGLTVKIVTSPLTRYENCVEEKHRWVEQHLGRDWVKQIILTKDKTYIRGDILIDDNPEITGDLEPVWEHIIFDRSVNRHITNKRRLTSWSDWRTVLLSSSVFD